MVTEHFFRSTRHGSFYLAAGPHEGPLIIFVHGWPELAISWRHQLEAFAALGYRAIAPDMRSYGRSTVHAEPGAHTMEAITRDMVELLDHLGRSKAVWVGHDWGSPVVWSLAAHHADRCGGVANLCVPYIPAGFVPNNLVPLVDRSVYPVDRYPAGQWDYQLYHLDHFERSHQVLDADPLATVKALMRRGDPSGEGKAYRTASFRRDGGWFSGASAAPDLPRDDAVLSEEALCAYAAALGANGFAGPDAWYANPEANERHARSAPDRGRLHMPVLFLHATCDWICETRLSRLADPMRAACDRLSEAVVPGGHWLQQENPMDVNARLVDWLGLERPFSLA